MSFSNTLFEDTGVETVGVYISKKTSSIENFLQTGEIESEALFLGTGTGSLIELEHKLGAGNQPVFTLRFVDPAGQTLQRLMSFNINDLIDFAKPATNERLFAITYGAGRKREEWAGPHMYFLINAEYEILPEGLEITTLSFSPHPVEIATMQTFGVGPVVGSVQGRAAVSPLAAVNRATSVKAKPQNITIGSVGPGGAVTLLPDDDIIKAITNVYAAAAKIDTGLSAIMLLPKKALAEYLKSSFSKRYPTNNIASPFKPGDLDGSLTVWPGADLMNKSLVEINLNPKGNDIFQTIDTNNDNKIDILRWGTQRTYIDRVVLLNLPGLTVTKQSKRTVRATLEWEPDQFVQVDESFPYGPPVITGANRHLGTQQDRTGFDWERDVLEDPLNQTDPMLKGGTAFIEIDPFDEKVKTEIQEEEGVIVVEVNMSDLWKNGEEDINLALEKLFAILSRNSPTSPPMKSALYTITDLDLLKKLKKKGMGNGTNPLVVAGSHNLVTSAVIPLMSPPINPLMGPPINPNPLPIPPPPIDLPYIQFESGKNILSYKVDLKTPGIAFFKNNVQLSNNGKDIKNKKDVEDFIAKKFKEAFDLVPGTPNAAEQFEFYNWEKVAKQLTDWLTTKNPDALDDYFIESDTSLGGLLDYIMWFYEYTILGAITARIDTLPMFTLSNITDFNRKVGVILKRNPSPYGSGVLGEHSSFYSGMYRILGWRHVITNTEAYSSFTLGKWTIGQDATSSLLNPSTTFNLKDPWKGFGPV